jgi:hypothetical protein
MRMMKPWRKVTMNRRLQSRTAQFCARHIQTNTCSNDSQPEKHIILATDASRCCGAHGVCSATGMYKVCW